MSVYLLRKKSLGKSSVGGIIHFSKKGILGFRNDGTQQILTGVWGEKGPKSKYVPGEPEGGGVCIRWGCTGILPPNTKIINQAKAIHVVADKAGFRKKTADAGLAPETWLFGTNTHQINIPVDTFPVVVRPGTHAQGKHLDVVYDIGLLAPSLQKYGSGYISKLVNKVKEFRVFVHQGRVVWVAEKKPGNPDDVAWNVAQGGMFTNVKWGEWDINVVKNALASYHLSGLDFGGVDVMVDAEGKCYTLEINSAPSQTSKYRQECVARAFDWSIEHGWDVLPHVTNTAEMSWKNFIHPGVKNPVEG